MQKAIGDRLVPCCPECKTAVDLRAVSRQRVDELDRPPSNRLIQHAVRGVTQLIRRVIAAKTRR